MYNFLSKNKFFISKFQSSRNVNQYYLINFFQLYIVSEIYINLYKFLNNHLFKTLRFAFTSTQFYCTL